MRIHLGIVLLSIVALASIGCTGVHVTRSGPHSAPAHNVGHGPPAHAPAHGYRNKYQYRYYPDAQVYYAADRGLYFWIEGGNWKLGARLPDHITVDLSGGVSVEFDSDTPGAHHRKGGPKTSRGKGGPKTSRGKGGPKTDHGKGGPKTDLGKGGLKKGRGNKGKGKGKGKGR